MTKLYRENKVYRHVYLGTKVATQSTWIGWVLKYRNNYVKRGYKYRFIFAFFTAILPVIVPVLLYASQFQSQTIRLSSVAFAIRIGLDVLHRKTNGVGPEYINGSKLVSFRIQKILNLKNVLHLFEKKKRLFASHQQPFY